MCQTSAMTTPRPTLTVIEGAGRPIESELHDLLEAPYTPEVWEQVKQLRQRLRRAATQQPLTAVPNPGAGLGESTGVGRL